MHGQGLIISEPDGANIVVVYDAKNAPLLAAAPDMAAKIDRIEAVNGELLAALEEIAEGAGPFSMDPLTHAGNTIEAMKEIARAAIAKAKGDK